MVASSIPRKLIIKLFLYHRWAAQYYCLSQENGVVYLNLDGNLTLAEYTYLQDGI